MEEEIRQKQGQKRKISPSGVQGADKALADEDHTAANQRKKTQISQEAERLKNERTVFVGNLPVTCNKKVSVWSVDGADSERRIIYNFVQCSSVE